MDIKKIIDYFNQSPESFVNTSGMSGAKTYSIELDDKYYLKIWQKGSLKKEYDTLCYFGKLGYTLPPCGYISTDMDYLLTKEIKGRPASNDKFIHQPELLAISLGNILRTFHSASITDLPFSNSVSDMLIRVNKNYKQQSMDLKLAQYVGNTDINQLYGHIMQYKSCLVNDVVLHGDYCLPNIILNNDFSFSGFLDMGAAGLGDRHYDLFWGRWSLQYNLKTDKYGDLFFDTYGRELIDPMRLKTIGYISCLDG